jgi:Asp-tRNA(Asn)/Glu-tRNA(Gln) amidotransferase A subunit family amidase
VLLADTHLPKRAKALPDEVWRAVDAADGVVHAGDWVDEALPGPAATCVLPVDGGALSLLTRPVNLAGLPAVSVPAGASRDGMPVGVQVIGGRGAEATLISVAELLEREDPRFRVAVAPPPAGA